MDLTIDSPKNLGLKFSSNIWFCTCFYSPSDTPRELNSYCHRKVLSKTKYSCIWNAVHYVFIKRITMVGNSTKDTLLVTTENFNKSEQRWVNNSDEVVHVWLKINPDWLPQSIAVRRTIEADEAYSSNSTRQFVHTRIVYKWVEVSLLLRCISSIQRFKIIDWLHSQYCE